MLNRAAVAALIGLKPKSISQYLTESRPGGRYEQHPFPAPDGTIGRAPGGDPNAPTRSATGLPSVPARAAAPAAPARPGCCMKCIAVAA